MNAFTDAWCPLKVFTHTLSFKFQSFRVLSAEQLTIRLINCIYIIFCKKCKMFYVGETINLQSRMYNHINDIKTFKPFETKDKCVPLHFRTKNHVENDFSFFVLQSNINNDENRFQLKHTTYI